jgi:hypothetical protein
MSTVGNGVVDAITPNQDVEGSFTSYKVTAPEVIKYHSLFIFPV